MMAEDYSEKSISMEKMKKSIDRARNDFSFICNGPAICRVRSET
jgi:hypothetical protein